MRTYLQIWPSNKFCSSIINQTLQRACRCSAVVWPTVVSLALGAQIPTYLHTHMTMSCPRAHSLDRAKGRHGEPEKINCAMQFWSFEIGSASLTPKLCTCKCDTIFRLHLALFGSFIHIRKDCPIVQEKSPRMWDIGGKRNCALHFEKQREFNNHETFCKPV